MTHTIFRRRLQRLIPGVIATVLIGIAVAVFLRSIGDLLTLLGPVFGLSDKDVDTYSAIFNQLKAASLNLPLMLLLKLLHFCRVSQQLMDDAEAYYHSFKSVPQEN